MTDSPAEKRRRSRDGSSRKDTKKADLQRTEPRVALVAHVSKVFKLKVSPPVVAVSPGIILSDALKFDTYEKERPATKKRKHDTPNEIILRSSTHRTIDYTGVEDNPYLNHYVGIYDPESGDLEVIQAKNLTVRGNVRTYDFPDQASSDGKTMMSKRQELGEAFGTRKSKKAIQSMLENNLMGAGSGEKLAVGDRMIVDSIKKRSRNMATREELQAEVDQARPVPRGNYDAEEIQDVYIPAELIGPEVLNAIPIMDWQQKVRAQEELLVPSRFVASRVNRVAGNDNAVERLKVMRYLLWVIIFWASTTKGKERGTLSIGRRDKLRELLAPAPEIVIESIRRKFSDSGVMRKAHTDLLMTHCCVFASIIDNFEVNTWDLREDLKLEQKQITQYFLEIGARVKQSKGGDRMNYIAKLALPLQFPQVRQVRQAKRR
ncbi:RNA polymerase I associated factor, A49-like protein [Lasiosphaeria miniovina]|uniref:RNA polymerase I associated factor, A49-like protein n=1 Tax=Lasiosphaeria miniovina TaxID=1954250 RepID=A0AA40A4H4_9PEZI|nr:RNA polymerase I associated factor, A49-like protein [Lasiosphaeria miniovina]KAK0709107.1 RNA polymerase I associated factor, A49-like protein [Lasiosphaeria miniovina]